MINPVKIILDKYNKMGVQAKAAAWYTVCNILQKGISFLVVPIYVRMLTTAEYGRYTVFQSWKEILVIFATLNLYCGVFTKAMVDHAEDRERYTSCMQTLSTLFTAILFAIYLTAVDFWNNCLDMDTVTVLMMFAYFVFYPAFQFWSTHQRVVYRYKRMVVITLLVSVLTPAVSILLLNLTDLREDAVIWGYLLVQIAVGAFFYFYNYIKGKCIYHKEYWSHAIRFNVPLIPHYLSMIALSQIDRIMIKEMCGDDKAGIYSFTFSISQLLNVFIAAINSAIIPWIYENLKKKEYGATVKTTNGLCVLIGAMTLGVMLVAPEIVRIIGTEDYMEAVWIIPAVTLSVFFTFVYGLFSNVEFYYSATRFVMVASVVAAVVKIAANALLLPIFGYLAAGYTTLGCYVLLAIMHYCFMRKICLKEIGDQKVYDAKCLLLLSVVLTGLMLICLLLYSNTVVRYSAIIMVLLVLYIFRQRIVSIVKQFV